MIVAGFLAIVIPPVAGIAVTILVGWLLVFSGVTHFVYAWHTRGYWPDYLGDFSRDRIHVCGRLRAVSSAAGHGRAYVSPRYLPFRRGRPRIHPWIPTSASPGLRLAIC